MKARDVALSHPVSAANKRLPKTQQVLEESQDIFNKIEKGELSKESSEKKIEPVKTLDPIKSRGIKELLFFGSLTKVIEIDGFTFELKTLNHSMTQDISKRIMLMDSEQEKLTLANLLFLSASLDKINNLDTTDAYLKLFDKEVGTLSKIEVNLEILSNLNSHLVGFLIDEYFKLSGKSKEILNMQMDGKETESAENLK